MPEPEPELVHRAARGDLEAFEELVRSCQAQVYRVALVFVRDRGLAEDVTQETFLRAYRSLGGFRGDAKVTTWLCRIARNAAVDAVRRAAHQRALAERMREPDDGPDPSIRVAVAAAVDGLPVHLREPFVLIEVLGFSYREAAKVLSVLEGTLKSRMHKARSLLMAALGEAEGAAGEV